MPDDWLLPYYRFHLEHEAAKVIEEGGWVTGFAVCRRLGRPPRSSEFDWTPGDPQGEHFVIGDIVVATTEARRELCRFFLAKWPDCKYLWSHTRDGRPKRITNKTVERLGQDYGHKC